MPSGDLIMSGEGHKDWLSGLQFHPRGSHLATAAGDGTVKLWDFASASCVATYTDHTQPVWSVDFHHSGVSTGSKKANVSWTFVVVRRPFSSKRVVLTHFPSRPLHVTPSSRSYMLCTDKSYIDKLCHSQLCHRHIC